MAEAAILLPLPQTMDGCAGIPNGHENNWRVRRLRQSYPTRMRKVRAITMGLIQIPNEAVEAAARAMLDAMYDDKTLKVDDGDRGIIRDVLTAAAPFIAAQAWDEATDATIDYAWLLTNSQDSDPVKPANPYRSGA